MTYSINDCKCPQKSKIYSNGLWSTELLLYDRLLKLQGDK